MVTSSRRQSSQLPKIDHLSADDLKALIAQAERQLVVRRDETKTKLLADMRLAAEKVGIDFDELVGQKNGKAKRRDVGVKLKPKYVGPNGETYKGKGPVPKWLKALERKGVDREKFRVKGA